MTADWIAVDWGTSNLRAFAMRGGEVLAQGASDQGMGSLGPDGFEPALLRLIDPWLGTGQAHAKTPVVICGMAGARGGWVEAPYRIAPCAPVMAGETIPVRTRDPRIVVEIVPGLCQPDPADVMRGEETQIAGFLAETPGFAGRLILPGTHSKHVAVQGGQVTGFSTWMTGELFALVSQQSVLRLTLAGGPVDQPAAFAEGVQAGAAGGVLGQLFSLRAEALLKGLDPASARARLSGLLIGAELSGLRGIAPMDQIVVIGAGGLARSYLAALETLGIAARGRDGADLVRLGLGLVRGERP